MLKKHLTLSLLCLATFLISACDPKGTHVIATSTITIKEENIERVTNRLQERLKDLHVKDVLTSSNGSKIKIVLEDGTEWTEKLKEQIEQKIKHWQLSSNTPVMITAMGVLPDISYSDDEEVQATMQKLEALNIQTLHGLALWGRAKVAPYKISQYGVNSTVCLLNIPLELNSQDKAKTIASTGGADFFLSSQISRNPFEPSQGSGGRMDISLTIKSIGIDYGPTSPTALLDIGGILYQECEQAAKEKIPELLNLLEYAKYVESVQIKVE